MSIRFFCSNCRQLLKAREDKIGRRMPCPKCKKPVTVPERSDPEVERARRQRESEGQVDPFAELIVYDTDIVYETEAEDGNTDDFDRRFIAIPRRVLYAHAILLATVTAAAFVCGYVAGHFTQTEPVPAEAAEPERIAIEGQLKWEGSTGDIADKGAVIIAVPESLAAQDQPLPGEELNPARPVPKRSNQIVRTIEDWGGDYRRTNEVGEFELFLKPGRYHVLFISQQSERPQHAEPSRDHLVSLRRYFSPPEELIGPHRYRWKVEEVKEGTTLTHVFAADGL
jgi:hypothetical protein